MSEYELQDEFVAALTWVRRQGIGGDIRRDGERIAESMGQQTARSLREWIERSGYEAPILVAGPFTATSGGDNHGRFQWVAPGARGEQWGPRPGIDVDGPNLDRCDDKLAWTQGKKSGEYRCTLHGGHQGKHQARSAKGRVYEEHPNWEVS